MAAARAVLTVFTMGTEPLIVSRLKEGLPLSYSEASGRRGIPVGGVGKAL
jgi:hypothetical protein